MSHARFQQRLTLASTTCHAPSPPLPACPFAWRLNNKLIWGTKRQLKLKSVSRRRPWRGQLGTERDRENPSKRCRVQRVGGDVGGLGRAATALRVLNLKRLQSASRLLCVLSRLRLLTCGFFIRVYEYFG